MNMRAHLGGSSTNFSSKLFLIGYEKVSHFEIVRGFNIVSLP